MKCQIRIPQTGDILKRLALFVQQFKIKKTKQKKNNFSLLSEKDNEKQEILILKKLTLVNVLLKMTQM